MHISKNESNNTFIDNLRLSEKKYHVNTLSPICSNIYTRTQVSQRRNIPIPDSSPNRQISNQSKPNNNSPALSSEKVTTPKRNITSIEISNPNQIIKQNITFKNPNQIEANPDAYAYVHTNPNPNPNQFSDRAMQVLLFNNSKPEGYLSIVSSKSFNIPDLKPDEFIQQRNKMREDREKMRSLSNLILHNKSTNAKAYSKKVIFDNVESNYNQNRSSTVSPNKKFVKQALNLLVSKRESKNVIITRAMRVDRGGVVDLGSIQRNKKCFNISNFNNNKLNTYSQKDKVNASLCIQLWWKRILLQYKTTIAKVTLIQSNYKRHFRQKRLLSNAKQLKKVEDFLLLMKLVYKDLYEAILKIKQHRPVRISIKERDALLSLDFMLIVNILVIKQRSFDRIKEKSTVNEISLCVVIMSKMFNVFAKRSIILNGDALLQKLRISQRSTILNDLFSYLALNQFKRKFNQYKTASFALIPNETIKRLSNSASCLFALLIFKSINKTIKKQNGEAFDELSAWESQSRPKLMLRAKPRLIKIIQEKTCKDYFSLFATWMIWKRKTHAAKVLKSVRIIQSQGKNFLTANHRKAIRMILYKRILHFPFDKIIQEAKRRTLIKSLFVIRKKKLNNCSYAFHRIKKYTEIKHLVQDICARIIQSKYFNAFPLIKAKHFEALRNKNHRCTSQVMHNACRLIQRSFKTHYLLKKTKGFIELKELFIDWLIRLNRSNKKQKQSPKVNNKEPKRFFSGTKILFKFFITNKYY